MSVDDRLREGLDRAATEFVPGAVGGLDAAVTAARRRRTGRRVVAGAALVAALVVAVPVLVDRVTGSSAPVVPAATVRPTSSAAVSGPGDLTASPEDAGLAAQLRGTWTTRAVSEQLAVAAMARTGTLAYRDAVLADLAVPGAFTLTLDDLAYRVSLAGEPVDEGTWTVRGGRVVLSPSCGSPTCRIVLGPEVGTGTLRLALVEDSSPDVDRVPSAAFASVIYTAAPFHRP